MARTIPARISLTAAKNFAQFQKELMKQLKPALRDIRASNKPFTVLDKKSLMFQLRTRLDYALYGDAKNILDAARLEPMVTRITGRSLATVDRFGLTQSQRIARAKRKLLKYVRQTATVAHRNGLSRKETLNLIKGVIEKQSPFKALIAYDTARAYNLSNLELLRRKGNDRVKVQLSPRHSKQDVCDDYVGEYNVDSVDLPPYHPYCLCTVREI